MKLKAHIKRFILEQSPLARTRRARMRERLTNREPSFFCPDCLGGILFHELGLQFRSPTVNLMMYHTDFVKFVKNLDAYLDGKFTFFKHPEFTCPCAYLEPVGGGWNDKITVHFSHYSSEEEALRKWYERSARIDRNNMFVFVTERDGLSGEEIASLSSLPVRGLLVFTINDYNLPYTVTLPQYKQYGKVGDIKRLTGIDGRREYEGIFDFVKWFNEANGSDFDVSPFVK